MKPITLEPKQIARFWTYVKKTDGCWIWLGGKDDNGYGKYRISVSQYKASRVSYTIHFGDPGEIFVLHQCDNPSCIRPDHLFLGDQVDNQRDCQAKYRRAEHKGNNNGHTNAMSKLNPAQLKDLRFKAALGLSTRELAKQFPIGKTAIGYILSGKTYKEC